MPNPSFWCEEHKTEWFKGGKMKAYAHPIKDEFEYTIGWCPMIKPKPKEEAAVAPSEPLRSQSVMSKDEWAEKDRPTRVSIHRQSASQRGVELVLGDRITFNQMPPWIKAFETYYDTGEWPVRPLTGYEPLGCEPMVVSPFSTPKPALTVATTPPSAYPMCPIKGHENMPLDKKTKDGTPAHEFTDAQGARHKCIPKLQDPSICTKHNVTMRQDAKGTYYHAVDEDSPDPEICKGG